MLRIFIKKTVYVILAFFQTSIAINIMKITARNSAKNTASKIIKNNELDIPSRI